MKKDGRNPRGGKRRRMEKRKDLRKYVRTEEKCVISITLQIIFQDRNQSALTEKKSTRRQTYIKPNCKRCVLGIFKRNH